MGWEIQAQDTGFWFKQWVNNGAMHSAKKSKDQVSGPPAKW
jgi:hypothetical protein